ncbi:hypothetical protein LTR78_003056 [Recurvomyces mirabilis]|uniref:Uncharacterized protein n=1 Tax=Recurvomyces mirabilis TaxID=574656 RepID=A0AAE0WS09_9PEZI|nr:hypothetical protein LTR78_003056 [Recurvomyces mirabilis]
MTDYESLAGMFARILSKETLNDAPSRPPGFTTTTPPRVCYHTICTKIPIINNLPLPPELRDEIYSYLLQAGAVRHFSTGAETPISLRNMLSAAHTYRFEAALFGVNKRIARESQEFFRKHNRFVLLKYNSPSFEKQLHALDVPIVAMNPLHHPEASLEVTIFWPFGPYYTIHTDNGEAPPEEETGTVLMLLQDLPKLLSMLKFVCHYANGPITYITSARSAPLQLERSLKRDLPIVSFEVLRTGGTHHLSLAEETTVLQGIATVLGLGRHLELIGFKAVSASELEQIKLTVAPTLACLRGLLWERLDTMLAHKQDVDELALCGRLDLAARKYRFLLDFARCGSLWPCQRHPIFIDNDSYNALLRYDILVHDLFYSHAVALISSARCEEFELRQAFNNVCICSSSSHFYQLNTAARDRYTWLVCAVGLAGIARYGNIQHNIIVQWMKASDFDRSHAADPIKSYLELFRDEMRLTELTAEERQVIYKFQYNGHLPITKFE